MTHAENPIFRLSPTRLRTGGLNPSTIHRSKTAFSHTYLRERASACCWVFQALHHESANLVGEAFVELGVADQEAHVDWTIK
jgi:hypothetical protein